MQDRIFTSQLERSFFNQATIYDLIPYHTRKRMCDRSIQFIYSNPQYDSIKYSRIRIENIWRFYVTMANFRSTEFITIKLERSDEKKFNTWYDKVSEDIFSYIQQTTDAGYKMSMSYDFENSTYIVALTGKKGTPNNEHKCFTSRSSELEESIGLALYKHWELAKGGDWSIIATSQNNWG